MKSEVRKVKQKSIRISSEPSHLTIRLTPKLKPYSTTATVLLTGPAPALFPAMARLRRANEAPPRAGAVFPLFAALLVGERFGRHSFYLPILKTPHWVSGMRLRPTRGAGRFGESGRDRRLPRSAFFSLHDALFFLLFGPGLDQRTPEGDLAPSSGGMQGEVGGNSQEWFDRIDRIERMENRKPGGRNG